MVVILDTWAQRHTKSMYRKKRDALIEAAKNGDREAMREAYERFSISKLMVKGKETDLRKLFKQ